jgi:threonyl-tRNA synthetase
LRVRSIAQNDAHIYCTPEQLKDELRATFQMCLDYYKLFRFQNITARYSTHSSDHPEKFVDNPEMWKFSEKIVHDVLEESKVNYVLGPGEAAFYGPKIDFQATTVVGREESISTTQVDFAQPIRFNLSYVAEDGKEHRPFIVHRAPLGAHERFVAFLIEHFGGAFPTWMAPTQVMIIPVKPALEAAAQELRGLLHQELLRVETDLSDNSFNKKIRQAVTHKIPNIVILGEKEAAAGTVTLRRYCVQEQLTISRDAFIDRMKRLVKERIMDNFADVTIS